MKIFDNKMSVRETEKLVKSLTRENKPKEQSKIDPENQLVLHSLEEKIKSIIGTKVSIKSKTNNKGKIEIEYYSMDELERIMDLFEALK